MRILLLTHYYEPELGAPQQRWGALIRRFRDVGHEVSVVAPPPHFPQGVAPEGWARGWRGRTHLGRHGETVHRVAYRPYADGLGSRLTDQLVSAADSARTALSRFRDSRPDVVIATAPAIPTLGAGATTAAALRAPLVTEMRDAWPDLLTVAKEWNAAAPPPPSLVSAALRPGLVRLASVATTALQRRSAAVVTTTRSFAAALRARGVPDVHVIRNGAHAVPGYSVHTPRTPDGELRVLYLGTIGRAQGLGSAVAAARLARARGDRVRLRIVGAGAERDAVAEMARRSDLAVELFDQVPKAEVALHYAWADTMLVALRPWPGLALTVPSKLYEAMSLGMHVTAAVSGEAQHIVEQTRAGIVVPPGDPERLADTWSQLARDPDALHVGPAGREWTTRHTNDDVLAERYLDVLHRVVMRA